MTDIESAGPRIYGDRYEIQRKIARGGMADVFLARDQLLDRPVALKVLFAELSVDPSFVERFRREAQNAARLSHPNVVSVYDWGEEADAASTYFIVMEYVTGRPLSVMLREDGPMPASRAALVGSEVAAALSFAHKNGVVHRYVKPGNVLIDDRGLVKVTDFGIARARNTTENLTQTGAVMGTATYFSPEQAQGFAVDQRSDVYSLGVVLYEMVAGRPPFQGDNPVTIAYKHVRETPEPLQRINPEIPAAYAAIASQAMAKAPSDRYATAEDLRADLVRFTSGQRVRGSAATAPVNATQAIPTVGAATRVAPAAVAAAPPRKRKGVKGPLLLALSLIAAMVIGAIVFLNWGSGGSNDPVTVPALIGKPKADAEQLLRDQGLRWTETTRADEAAKDTVVAQEPREGTAARQNDIVQLTLSLGPAAITLDSFVNQSEAAAKATLTRLGLKVQTTSTSSDTIQQGNVIFHDPPAGREVPKGSTVTLTISSGPQKIEVPNVVGFNVRTAVETLSDAGLRSSVAAGTDPSELVVSMDPTAGSQVEKGTTITLEPASATTTTSTTSPSSSTTSTTARRKGGGD